jgi:hypothetical protein
VAENLYHFPFDPLPPDNPQSDVGAVVPVSPLKEGAVVVELSKIVTAFEQLFCPQTIVKAKTKIQVKYVFILFFLYLITRKSH